MNLKDVIKKNKIILKLYNKYIKIKYECATRISPELNTRMWYYKVFKKKINLENPKTFSEKLLWLKLNIYSKDPLVFICADKFKVREYVKECGCENILNELYNVYDTVDEINIANLPKKFVLKWNFGAGMNIVCSDKNELNEKIVYKKLRKWEKNKYWLLHSEMQYKCEKKKLLCEKYLENLEDDVIPDYKVYCFNGEPKAILVLHDRNKEVKSEFFDCNWNLLKNTNKYDSPKHITKKPPCLKQMLSVSKQLSKPFPFVRCDYYVVDGKLYFGEMTFTPAGGLYASETIINGKKMEELLDISDLVKDKNR